MNFNLNNVALDLFNKEKTQKKQTLKLKKITKGTSLIISPAKAKMLKENKVLFHNKRSINLNRLVIAISLNEISTYNFNVHQSVGGVPLSESYLKARVPHFSTRDSFKSVFNLFFDRIHQGNPYDTLGCSAYDKVTGEQDLAYTKTDKIVQFLSDYFSDKITLGQYTAFFNEKLKEVKSIKISKLITSNKELYLSSKKVPDSANSTKTVRTKKVQKLPKQVLKNIDSLYSELQNRVQYRGYEVTKRELGTISSIKNSIVNGNLVLENSVSLNNGREFNTITGAPKDIRNIVFQGYLSLDISNAAYSMIRTKLISEENEHKFPLFMGYLKNRDSIICSIADSVLKDEDLKVNRRTKEYQEVKGYIKLNFLSLLFGSQLSTFNLRKGTEQEVKDIISALPEVKGLKVEIRTLAKQNNSTVKELGNAFMTIETAVMTEIEDAFRLNYIEDQDPFIAFRVHDEVIVPRGSYRNGTTEVIQNILNKYKLSTKDLDLNEAIFSDLVALTPEEVVFETNEQKTDYEQIKYIDIELLVDLFVESVKLVKQE